MTQPIVLHNSQQHQLKQRQLLCGKKERNKNKLQEDRRISIMCSAQRRKRKKSTSNFGPIIKERNHFCVILLSLILLWTTTTLSLAAAQSSSSPSPLSLQPSSLHCELQCMNGGNCTFISYKVTDLVNSFLSNKLVQKCICPEQWTGLACDIPVILKSCNHNTTTTASNNTNNTSGIRISKSPSSSYEDNMITTRAGNSNNKLKSSYSYDNNDNNQSDVPCHNGKTNKDEYNNDYCVYADHMSFFAGKQCREQQTEYCSYSSLYHDDNNKDDLRPLLSNNNDDDAEVSFHFCTHGGKCKSDFYDRLYYNKNYDDNNDDQVHNDHNNNSNSTSFLHGYNNDMLGNQETNNNNNNNNYTTTIWSKYAQDCFCPPEFSGPHCELFQSEKISSIQKLVTSNYSMNVNDTEANHDSHMNEGNNAPRRKTPLSLTYIEVILVMLVLISVCFLAIMFYFCKTGQRCYCDTVHPYYYASKNYQIQHVVPNTTTITSRSSHFKYSHYDDDDDDDDDDECNYEETFTRSSNSNSYHPHRNRFVTIRLNDDDTDDEQASIDYYNSVLAAYNNDDRPIIRNKNDFFHDEDDYDNNADADDAVESSNASGGDKQQKGKKWIMTSIPMYQPDVGYFVHMGFSSSPQNQMDSPCLLKF